MHAKPQTRKFDLGEPTDKVLAKEKPDTPEFSSSSLLMSQRAGAANTIGKRRRRQRSSLWAGGARAFLPVSQQPSGDWHMSSSRASEQVCRGWLGRWLVLRRASALFSVLKLISKCGVAHAIIT